MHWQHLMRFIHYGYLQLITTYSTQGKSLHGKVYGRVPGPFSSLRTCGF